MPDTRAVKMSGAPFPNANTVTPAILSDSRKILVIAVRAGQKLHRQKEWKKREASTECRGWWYVTYRLKNEKRVKGEQKGGERLIYVDRPCSIFDFRTRGNAEVAPRNFHLIFYRVDTLYVYVYARPRFLHRESNFDAAAFVNAAARLARWIRGWSVKRFRYGCTLRRVRRDTREEDEGKRDVRQENSQLVHVFSGSRAVEGFLF